MGKALPDRWQKYGPIGKKIDGTRFIAFKVPLEEHISSTVGIDKRLDDKILMEGIPNLGLIIDLTNTTRYYNPQIFKKNGIQHEKIMIPGHEVPPKNLTETFIRTVNKFVKNNKNNDKLIGVHCTHGVNRTGYLICHYMVSEMTISPKVAINKFASARGYKIERLNYITALQKLAETKHQNCRKHEQADLKPRENWREKRENPKSSSRYRNLISSRSRQPSLNRSNDNISPNPQASNRADEVSKNYYAPAERYKDHHCANTNRRTRLAFDYYNAKPAFKSQRYNRFSALDDS